MKVPQSILGKWRGGGGGGILEEEGKIKLKECSLFYFLIKKLKKSFFFGHTVRGR